MDTIGDRFLHAKCVNQHMYQHTKHNLCFTYGSVKVSSEELLDLSADCHLSWRRDG